MRSGHPGMDAGVAATRPWMADRGGPTEQCLTAGMPSLGEAPSGGARALCLLWRSSKVSRRKGGTLSGRDRSNGYVHRPRRELCRYLRLSQASQFPHKPPLHLNYGDISLFYRQKKAAHRPSAPQTCREAQQQRFGKANQSSSANASAVTSWMRAQSPFLIHSGSSIQLPPTHITFFNAM